MTGLSADHIDLAERAPYYAYLPRRRAQSVGSSDPNSTIFVLLDANSIFVISNNVERTSGSPVPASRYAQGDRSIVTVAVNVEEGALYEPSTPAASQLAADLHRLKRLSGLTWDGIAELTHTSRQAVYKWTQGGAIAEANQRRISRLLVVIQAIDQGTGAATKVLLGENLDHRTVFDHLKDGHFDLVSTAFRSTLVSSDESWGKVSPRLGEPPALATQMQMTENLEADANQPIQVKPIRRFRMKTA
ncbi:hypothetical protein [Asticcacaulis sp. 201]|uniref:hypothetical protein n=1 Tax=Asticcacaulis sp. 201 TaxID=3028787 RepID=UPI002915F5DD|nr:hypothetical protein [Asticcacaulis sp. 201]MDV6333076.1 hypothetical protein [Asticcacaulis sp. 201]